MNTLLCFLALSMIGVLVTASIGIFLECKSFNGGTCPVCGKKLRYYSHDSHGSRGYICDSCGYDTWASYDCVDKNFKEAAGNETQKAE